MNRFKRILFRPQVSILLLLSWSVLACYDQRGGPPSITVNDIPVFKEAIALRADILNLDHQPDAMDYALYQLVKSSCLEVIASQYDYSLTDSMLMWESQRIDLNSMLPEKIATIKEICGNEQIYQEVFIKVSLYPRRLNEKYRWDRLLHASRGNLAKQLFTTIRADPELFEKSSIDEYTIHEYYLSSAGLERINGKVDSNKNKSEIFNQLKDSISQVEERVEGIIKSGSDLFTSQLLTSIHGLKKGQFHPRPLQTPDAFWILQYVKKENDKNLIRILSVPKITYSEWIEEEIRKVPITIYDEVAWDAMIKVIPSARDQFQNVVNPTI